MKPLESLKRAAQVFALVVATNMSVQAQTVCDKLAWLLKTNKELNALYLSPNANQKAVETSLVMNLDSLERMTNQKNSQYCSSHLLEEAKKRLNDGDKMLNLEDEDKSWITDLRESFEKEEKDRESLAKLAEQEINELFKNAENRIKTISNMLKNPKTTTKDQCQKEILALQQDGKKLFKVYEEKAKYISEEKQKNYMNRFDSLGSELKKIMESIN